MFNKVRQWFFARTAGPLSRLNEPFYGVVNWLANTIILLFNPERVTKLGNLHPDKTFYVIRDLPPYAGVASWYDRVVGYMDRAERKGWIPIVVPPPTAQPDLGDWYAYFKPLSNIPFQEVNHAQNVVFAVTHGVVYKRYNRRNISRRHELCKRIIFNDALQHFIDERFPALFADMPHPIIGVRFRGTDFRVAGNWRPIGHARVPDIKEFCDTIEADCRKWGVDVDGGAHIYLMTEEQEALDAICQRFPRCRYVVKERFTNFDFKAYLCYKRLNTITPTMNNFMYLLEMYALSKCDYIIGGYNGGVLVALNWNGNTYKDVHILSTGTS